MPVKREPLREGRVGAGALDPREMIVWALLVALFLGVRLWRLDASCLWFDEVFSVHAARHGWGELLEFVALDLIHPPLFYLLLKVWMAVVGGGEPVWWLRLFPLLTQAAAVVPLLLLGRELGLRRRQSGVMRVALLLLAVNGYLIQHAQQLRMYSLLLLLALCSLWLFARFSDAEARRGAGALAALFAVNLLLVYTHYFGWLLVGLEGLFVAVWRREKLKLFAVSLVALAVCFSPWVWLVLRATGAEQGLLAQNIGWQARPSLTDIFHPFLLLHEPFRFRRNTYEPLVLRVDVWLTVALFVPLFVALCWRAMRQRRAGGQLSEDDTAREEAAAGDDAGVRATAAAATVGHEASTRSNLTFLLFFSLAPVLVTFVLARVLPQSIWGTRHLIIIAPAYLLLASVALVSLRRPVWLAVSVKLLLACWLTLAATLWLMRRHEPPVWCAWETLARKVVAADANAAGEVRIYAAEDLVAYHLWYGISAAGDRRFRVVAVKNLPGLREDRAYFLPRGFDEVAAVDASAAAVMREPRFWVAFRDTTWNTEHPLLRLLAERGYDVEPRVEVAASGQKAFLVYAKRRGL